VGAGMKSHFRAGAKGFDQNCAGVSYVLSEDFQDGFELQDVTFINPFNPRKIN
jgi:hypothetical protein